MRPIIIVTVLLALAGQALAEEDTASANFLMPACRNPAGHAYLAGVCIGMIAGIVAGATLRSVELGAPSLLCIPRGVTREQELRVVVRYIDERPEQMHLWFSVLAYDALKAAWPCKP